MIHIGSFAGKNILLEFASLAHISRLDLRAIEGRFSVLLLLNDHAWSENELRNAVHHLLLHGARYFTVHGNEGERAHDLINTERDKYDLPTRPVVMTVWIDEPIEEAIEFALLSAMPSFDLEFDVNELLVIGRSYFKSIDKIFFDTIKRIQANASESEGT